MIPKLIWRLATGAVLTIVCCGCSGMKTQPQREKPMMVNASETFDLSEPGDSWSFRTPNLWHLAQEADRHFLQMDAPPQRPLLPGVPRPQEYAIYRKYEFRSFNLSCRVRVDCEPSVAVRDAVVIFGRQDRTHGYYLHLANQSGDFHNTLVRLDGKTRRALVPSGSLPPTATDKAWHRVDIQRDADKGTITVYFDYDERDPKPLLQITDRTYEWGFIGVGSFNDYASFGRVLIEGQARKPAHPLDMD